MEEQDFVKEYDKDKMISDIIFMFGEGKDKLSDLAKFDVLKAIGWHFTERKGKHDPKAKIWGCTYWSYNAYEIAFKETDTGFLRKNINIDKELRHEHVVPKSVFLESIWHNQNRLPELNIKEVMQKNFFACVVTKKEAEDLDKKYKNCMPNREDLFSIQNPWERYIKAGFESVLKLEWELGTRRSWQLVSKEVYKLPR